MGSNANSRGTTIIIHSEDEESDQERGGGRERGHSEEEEEEVEEVDMGVVKQRHTPPSDSVTSYTMLSKFYKSLSIFVM